MKKFIMFIFFIFFQPLIIMAYTEDPKQMGDLVFRCSLDKIYGRDGTGLDVYLRPGHVGIYIGEGQIIHALGWEPAWFPWVPLVGEVIQTPINPVEGERSFYDADEDGDRDDNDHHPLGSKTHINLYANPKEQTLRDNIVFLATDQVGKGFDNNLWEQKGPNSDDWTCCGLSEKVYESCYGQLLIYHAHYGDEIGYAGGLNITPDGYIRHFNDTIPYYQNGVEFSQVPTYWPIGRTFDGGIQPFIFFPYTQYEQSNLRWAFDGGTMPPSVTMTAPTSTVTVDDGVTIKWNDSDPDSNATITLWRDNDNTGYNGTVLVTGLNEDDNGSYGFYNLPTSGMADCEQFYVYASIDDGHTMNYSTNYTAKIIVDHPSQGSDVSIYEAYWTDDPPNADGDGVPEAGEEVVLELKLKNNASITINSVEARLSTPDPDINIHDNYEDYGSLPPGGISIKGDFRMTLNFTETKSVLFNLNVVYTKNSLEYYQNFPLNKTFPKQGTQGPIFELDHIVIDDSKTVYSGNNNDGILQSGEVVHFDIYLKNIGTATATEVEAKATDVKDLETGTISFDVFPGWEDYPDLPPNSTPYKQNDSNFDRITIPKNFKGIITGDITIKYGSSGIEQILNDQSLFNVQTTSWLKVIPEDYYFGVISTTDDVIVNVEVRNIGTKEMTVSAITPSHSDTMWTGDPLPWTIQGQSSKSFTATIETSALDGQTISREVIVTSNARIDDEGIDDRIVISGLVSDSISIYKLSNSIYSSYPDISGEWIVYQDGRNGNDDIYIYNLSSGVETQITNEPSQQSHPRISNNLVVWRDWRNDDGSLVNSDIYGYDMSNPALGVFQIATSPLDDDLIGVDNNLVAFAQQYDTIYDNDGDPHEPYNLVVYEYQGNGQFNQRFTTGWSQGSGTETRQTIDDFDSDFGDGLLVFERFEWIWTGTYWAMYIGDQWVEIIDFAAGESSPHRVLDSFGDPYAAAEHKFVFQEDYEDPQGNSGEQVWIWESGSIRRLTDPGTEEIDHINNILAIGNSIVVYDKDSFNFRQYLFYWDLNKDQSSYPEYLVTNQVRDSLDGRMDGNALVWQAQDQSDNKWYLYYAFFGGDLSITSADIQPSIDLPYEQEDFDVIVKVKNIGIESIATDVLVKLFDGNPDISGTQVGSTQTIVGGIVEKSEGTVTFNNISLSEGTHNIYAKCETSVFENPTNNKSSKEINIQDTDINPPVISNESIGEHNGDGDGYIEDNEQVIVTWTLTDESGIGDTTCKIDNTLYPVTNTYQSIAGPFGIGEHSVEITAVDADTSPETLEPWTGTFKIYAHAPQVDSVNPANNSTDIQRDTLIEIKMSFPPAINSSSVKEGVFELRDSAVNLINGTLSFESSENKIIFTPNQLLDYLTTYTGTLFSGENGITDLIGNHLESDYVWSFTTLADIIDPVANIVLPQNNQEVFGEVLVYGTAFDDNFDKYIVEYGEGSEPLTWVNISESTTSVQFGELCKWNVLSLNGNYTLRLTVNDKASHSVQDSVSININNSPPDKPSSPLPEDGALDVPIIVNLDWGDSARATSYDLYLWKASETKPSEPTAPDLLVSGYDPDGDFDYYTEYKWQVVAKNTIGNTPGAEWRFTTQIAPPEEPSGPLPADTSTNISITTNLDWSDSARATFYDLYLWKASEPKPSTPTVSDLIVSIYDPPSDLEYDIGYKWQVIAKNNTGQTQGDEWLFTTESGNPEKPSSPSPPHLSFNVPIDTEFDWADCARTTAYDIYIWLWGDPEPGDPTVSDLIDSRYVPSDYLLYNKQYEWRVIAKNSFGSTEGDEWVIRTCMGPYAKIDSPPLDQEILAGKSIYFSGTKGGYNVTNLWDFDGAAPDSNEEDPGEITFTQRGAYTIIYKVTDEWGTYASDSVLITVNDPAPQLISISLFDKDKLTEDVISETDCQEIEVEIESSGTIPTHIKLSENENFDGAYWREITDPIIFRLTSKNGEKTVYAKVGGLCINESNSVSDSINLNTNDDAQIVSDTIPLEMRPDQRYRVSVTLQNTGASIWPFGWDWYRLGSVGDSDDLGGQGRYPMPKDVYPNDEVTIYFYLTAPTTPDEYTTDWQMVKEGEHWFGEKLVKIVNVGDGLILNNSKYVIDYIPKEVTLKQERLFIITFKNTGNATWTQGDLYRLGVVGDNPPKGFPGRIELPYDVIPGEEVTFNFWICPKEVGDPTITYQMLQEYVEWFGEQIPKTITVTKYTGVDEKIFELYQ